MEPYVMAFQRCLIDCAKSAPKTDLDNPAAYLSPNDYRRR